MRGFSSEEEKCDSIDVSGAIESSNLSPRPREGKGILKGSGGRQKKTGRGDLRFSNVRQRRKNFEVDLGGGGV